VRIKEVSQITGLTEKTIRFYEEKQLLQPEQTEINGRIFRSYTEQNIATVEPGCSPQKAGTLPFLISSACRMIPKYL
jgi:hypothetical protein